MWHSEVIDGYWFEAKVYDEGSQFGINCGRVSKLHICKGNHHDPSQDVYRYDRGIDFNKCPAKILKKILARCESLPVAA